MLSPTFETWNTHYVSLSRGRCSMNFMKKWNERETKNYLSNKFYANFIVEVRYKY